MSEATATLSEFAALLGVGPSYVTALKKAGRLVLTAGGRVEVAASKQRIEETKDPNRDDVRARHAAARAAETPAAPAESPPASDAAAALAGKSYQTSRAVKERYLALTAKMEYEQRAGRLVETAAVQSAGTEAGALVRALLENLPDQLAPVLAPVTDEDRCRALLADHVETLLTEIAHKIEALGRKLAAPAA